ncbi:MAG: sulfite oxidase [Pirellulales bacterium]|nr:sulfite oxidase [Pirellulales bacterium]
MTQNFSTRRQFLRSTTAWGLSSSALALHLSADRASGADQPPVPATAAPGPPRDTADKIIPGKDARLIVHSPRPGEIETPLELLRAHSVTPQELMFVRNNQFPADALTLEPDPNAAAWSLSIGGMPTPVVATTVEQLRELPQTELEVVLQCSGNSRSLFHSAAPVEGVPWQQGAMANVVFGGVRLQDLFRHLKITPPPDARFLTAAGADPIYKPGSDDFEHSVPLADALARGLLALTLNGGPLPRVHGGPLRLVMPGYYATMHVKWLNNLLLADQESTNHHHVGRYRTPLEPIAPGQKFTSTLANSEPNWRMKIKSVIFAPLPGEQLRPDQRGQVELRGVAWNDGRSPLETVQLSLDEGRTWLTTELASPASPYAWHPWRLAVKLLPGKHTLLARAIDALGRTQPRDGATAAWNPAGYAWNGVDTVTFTVG